MKAKNLDSHSVYPGEFIPAANETFIIKQVKRLKDHEANRPYTNIKELIDKYKVEIAAPGFERDKLIVYADNKNLLVYATENYNKTQPDKCFQRHINLPDDADVELAIAEYHNNMLELYIPKANQPCNTGPIRIIVY